MAKAYLDELLCFFASRFREYLLVWNEELAPLTFPYFLSHSLLFLRLKEIRN